jgi:DNA topoisomerase-3
MGKKINDTILEELSKKGETSLIKGFVNEGKKVNGKLQLNNNFELKINL